MKAADGTKIAERWNFVYRTALTNPLDLNFGRMKKLIEELSAAEERERVLRDALKTARLFVPTDSIGDRLLHRSFDAALATPAPEQPAQPKEKAEANKEGKS